MPLSLTSPIIHNVSTYSHLLQPISTPISSTDAQSARLTFLSSTAHLLANSAPPVSAHLMRECDDLSFEHKLHTPNIKLKKSNKPAAASVKGNIGHCSACGTIALPGRTCRIEIVRTGVNGEEEIPRTSERKKKGRKKKVKRTARTPKKQKAVKTTCLACHRSKMDVLAMASSGKETYEDTRQKDAKDAGEVKGESMTTLAPTVTKSPSANAASKARSKARKQGGLQHMLMLAKAKQPEQRDVGGLMDWMDSG